MKKKTSKLSWFGTGAFAIIGIVYIMPILIVLINSFKNKVFINKEPRVARRSSKVVTGRQTLFRMGSPSFTMLRIAIYGTS